MQVKSLAFTSPHLQFPHKTLISPQIPLSLNASASFNRFSPGIRLRFREFKSSNPRNSRKLFCINPSEQISGEAHEFVPETSDANGSASSIEIEEKVEIFEGKSDELANQSLREQIIEIVKFSGPATGLWICGPLMSLIDTVVIAQGSSIELAALGPGTVLCDYMSYIFMFLSIATSNMVATSLARQDKNQVQHQISVLLFVGLACGVLMLMLTKVSGAWALTAFTGAKNVHLVPAANTYIQIRALAWPAILVGSVAQSASLGMKDSVGPLKALLIASTINGVGDVVLCMFLNYGIAGAAWATMASQIVAAYTMVDALNKKGYNGFSISIPSLGELKEIVVIAAPVFLTIVSKVAFYSLLIYSATSMGTQIIAAHQVMSQIFSMCGVWGEPLSQTAQSFMPELLYGGRRSLVKARMLLKSLLIIGASVGLILGSIATFIPWFIPNFFTPDPEVISEMHRVLIPYFLALCVTPGIHSCEGTLLAGRDLKFITISMSGCFVLGSLMLLLVRSQGLGLPGCWCALVGFQWARFLLALSRLLSANGVLYSEDLDRYGLARFEAA